MVQLASSGRSTQSLTAQIKKKGYKFDGRKKAITYSKKHSLGLLVVCANY
jgi:hypothetical protein